MGILVSIIGQSGTGKSTSLRNFTNDEVAVINVSGKPMPFRSDLEPFSTNDYLTITNLLPQIKQPSIVIDDATYLMVDEFMRYAQTKGYEKYNIMAQNFFNLLEAARALPENRIIYFLAHIETSDDGREHFKTIGRMLDNYVTVEGKFTVVLKTVVKDGHYFFSTHNNGQDTVKSPIGMFEEDLIDNDLAAVDRIIREYWNIGLSK